jgi:hypothetical protein
VKKIKIVVVNPQAVTSRVTEIMLPLLLLGANGRKAGKNGKDELSLDPEAEILVVNIVKPEISNFIPDEMRKAGLLTIGFAESGFELSEQFRVVPEKTLEVLVNKLGIAGHPFVISEIRPILKGEKTALVQAIEAVDALFGDDIKTTLAVCGEIDSEISERKAGCAHHPGNQKEPEPREGENPARVCGIELWSEYRVRVHHRGW